MNETEHEFSLLLESWRQAGKILLWEYEALTLRWGVMSVLKYTPDFVIFDSIEVDDATPGVPRISMRMIEVKGPFIRNRQAAVRTWKDARERWHNVFGFEFWQKTPELGWHRVDL
jgi:hypothetical protein